MNLDGILDSTSPRRAVERISDYLRIGNYVTAASVIESLPSTDFYDKVKAPLLAGLALEIYRFADQVGDNYQRYKNKLALLANSFAEKSGYFKRLEVNIK